MSSNDYFPNDQPSDVNLNINSDNESIQNDTCSNVDSDNENVKYEYEELLKALKLYINIYEICVIPYKLDYNSCVELSTYLMLHNSNLQIKLIEHFAYSMTNLNHQNKMEVIQEIGNYLYSQLIKLSNLLFNKQTS